MRRFFTLLFCLHLWLVNADHYRYELAIGAIFRNEAPYLKEWIEFHKLVGVQHFYLFNNCSVDDYQSVLQPYIDKGEVELFDWPYLANSPNNWIYQIQPKAYEQCIHLSKGQTKWLALIDIDEFITPLHADTIQESLKNYETFGGIGFNWKVFGHSGLWDLPSNQLMIESLVMTAPLDHNMHLFVKPIVRPECVERCVDAHSIICKQGSYYVNSRQQLFSISDQGLANGIYYDHLVINHYWSRSGSYLYQKLKRYQTLWPNIIPSNWIQYVQGLNEIQDKTMRRFIPTLRQRMGFDSILDL